ncbi:14267_t:CDS:2 [Cetraspora pellucida]|uniref:14267_t:CDS:1 n=1 Tax=Cetraspora pellucida TaxID=1433469 RepID=A0A9N9FUY6_9GLOM|nr:14267_t:CDS:2 [Cetraspora pellucida]
MFLVNIMNLVNNSISGCYLNYLNRVQKEYDYYNANIINAVKDGKYNPNVVVSQILFKSFSSSTHIAYN